MTNFISIWLTGLSILVPILFILLLRKTRISAQEGRNNVKFNRRFALAIVFWSFFIWISGSMGYFAYQPGDIIPRFLVPLFFPVITVLLFLLGSGIKHSLDSMKLSQLVGFQFWRIFGVIFFLVASQKMGPQGLFVSGFGDLFTGILAITSFYLIKKGSDRAIGATWVFMLVGIADLLGVLYTLLVKYPIWSDHVPSSALAGEFPMIYLIGIVAPIALVFHVFTLRHLLNKKQIS